MISNTHALFVTACAQIAVALGTHELLQVAVASEGSLRRVVDQVPTVRSDTSVLDLLEQATQPLEDSRASRTMRSLDADGNGRVDPLEIARFVTYQGVSAAQMSGEFLQMDVNHDGSLDFAEVSTAMGDETGVQPVLAQQPESETVSAKVDAGLPVPSPALTTQMTSTSRDKVLDLPGVQNGRAETMAVFVTRQLSIQSDKNLEAWTFEQAAAELRANATALQDQTADRVLEAGRKAGQAKTEEILATLTQLESDAREAEMQAAALRAKARAGLLEAEDFMSVASKALGEPQQNLGALQQTLGAL